MTNNLEKSCDRVLVLNRIELIFFFAAIMRLCFGFVLETVLIPNRDVFVNAEQCLHRV